MNTESAIHNLINKIDNFDKYTQLSVLGSWSFNVNASCISMAKRYVPTTPDETDINTYSLYDQARAALIRDAENSDLAPMLALQSTLAGMIDELGGNSSGLEGTLEWLVSRLPTRKQFESEYELRRRAGAKPAMSMKQYTDHEYERAMKQHDDLVAKGELAVRLCQTIAIDDSRGFGDLPDWVVESFERKMISKLHDRWRKLEFFRMNAKRKEDADSAHADQMLIASVLSEFGETPGFAPEIDMLINRVLTDHAA